MCSNSITSKIDLFESYKVLLKCITKLKKKKTLPTNIQSIFVLKNTFSEQIFNIVVKFLKKRVLQTKIKINRIILCRALTILNKLESTMPIQF